MLRFYESGEDPDFDPGFEYSPGDRKFALEDGGKRIGFAAMGLDGGEIVLRGAAVSIGGAEYLDLLWRSLLNAASRIPGGVVTADLKHGFLKKHGFSDDGERLKAKAGAIIFPHECEG